MCIYILYIYIYTLHIHLHLVFTIVFFFRPISTGWLCSAHLQGLGARWFRGLPELRLEQGSPGILMDFYWETFGDRI